MCLSFSCTGGWKCKRAVCSALKCEAGNEVPNVRKVQMLSNPQTWQVYTEESNQEPSHKTLIPVKKLRLHPDGNGSRWKYREEPDGVYIPGRSIWTWEDDGTREAGGWPVIRLCKTLGQKWFSTFDTAPANPRMTHLDVNCQKLYENLKILSWLVLLSAHACEANLNNSLFSHDIPSPLWNNIASLTGQFV